MVSCSMIVVSWLCWISIVSSQTPTGQPGRDECDLKDDDLIVSWDDLFGDSTFFDSDDTFIELSQGTNDVSGTFEVTVKVESKYVVAAEYSVFEEEYEGVTENGYLGVTYVLDTNEFKSEGRKLQSANTCENRKSSSFESEHFLNDFWEYSLSPFEIDVLGNDMYLEYGDQNIWDLSMVDKDADPCGAIEWETTFSFHDLWHDCTDSDGKPSYELLETDDTISLNLNFYLSIVSPNPLYLTLCDDGAEDCGQYLVKTLISHPLSIVFSKQSSVISNKDAVFIDLFSSRIVGSIFVEDDSLGNDNSSSMFTLTMITTVPSYMSLTLDTADILSPTSDELIDANNDVQFIKDYYITEESSSYMVDEQCLILTEYRCFQKFEINVELSQCPSDTGLAFNGEYYFIADFECIGDNTVCDEYLSDEPVSITMDGVHLEYQELCDSTLYDVDWEGDISFYKSDDFDEIENVFEFGDTVYAHVSVKDDISDYEIFGMSIVECYLCTADISDSSDTELETCLDTSGIVDTGLFYIITKDTDLDYTLIDSDISDTHEQFSFVLPTLADDTFYVDCVIELEVNDIVDSMEPTVRRRRRRVLLDSTETETETETEMTGNVFGTSIGSASASAKVTSDSDAEGDAESGDSGSSNNGKNDEISTFSWILLTIGGLILVLLFVIVGYVMLTRRTKENLSNVNTALEITRNGPKHRVLPANITTVSSTTASTGASTAVTSAVPTNGANTSGNTRAHTRVSTMTPTHLEALELGNDFLDIKDAQIKYAE